jgi:hypothetical protein
MSIVYIRFDERDAEVRGVEELALKTRITAYRGGVYAVRQSDLAMLDTIKAPYRLATDAEVEAARGSVRHLVAPLL